MASWVRRQVSSEATDQDTGEPDILIFGFEEVDLSTGALLYSTSTVLEGAWTQTIVTSLGEHAHSYVKVALLPLRTTVNLIWLLVYFKATSRHANYWFRAQGAACIHFKYFIGIIGYWDHGYDGKLNFSYLKCY